jgi:hypothetical protein
MRTMATFRLIGDSAACSAARLTAQLGVQPSEAAEAGTPIGPRTPALRQESIWLLTSAEGPEADVELVDQLRRLLDVLEPVADRLWELVEGGYWANWFCYLGSHATEHAVELDRATLQRLLALPGDLWLDVYEDDTADRPDALPGS